MIDYKFDPIIYFPLLIFYQIIICSKVLEIRISVKMDNKKHNKLRFDCTFIGPEENLTLGTYGFV